MKFLLIAFSALLLASIALCQDRTSPSEDVNTRTPVEVTRSSPEATVDTRSPATTVDTRSPAATTEALPCSSKRECTCLQDVNCGFCSGVDAGGFPFNTCGSSDRVAGFCTRPGIVSDGSACAAAATPVTREASRDPNPVTRDINDGRVTEADVNQDLRKREPAGTTYTVVVTIITDAETRDGNTRFRTNFDVDSDVAVTRELLGRICQHFIEIYSDRLGVEQTKLVCDPNVRPAAKRLITSYVADMTVYGQGNGAGVAGVALGLLASAAALVFA